MNELFQEELPKTITCGLLIVAVIIRLITHIKSENRKHKLSEKAENPFLKEQIEIIQELKQLTEKDWPEYQESKNEVIQKAKSLMGKIDTALAEIRRQKKDFLRFEFLMNDDEFERIYLPEILSKKHQDSLRKVTSAVCLLSTSFDKTKKESYYIKEDVSLRRIEKELNLFEKGVSLYNAVILSAEKTLEEIESAEVMEVIDLFSKNKGISIVSTAFTASASSATEKLNSDLKAFTNYLNDLKNHRGDINPANFKEFETLDIVFDLFFDFGFDFTSLLALSALDDNEKEIKRVLSQIKPIGEKLKDQKQKLLRKKQDYLNNLN